LLLLMLLLQQCCLLLQFIFLFEKDSHQKVGKAEKVKSGTDRAQSAEEQIGETEKQF